MWTTERETPMTDRPERVRTLLDQAKAAREARDVWRAVGPILAALQDAGISFQEIHDHTGISPATAHGMIVRFRLSGKPRG